MEAIETNRKFLKYDRWDEWRQRETDQRKGLPPPAHQKPYPKDALIFDLVPPEEMNLGRMPVIEAIRRRRSRREYLDELLTLEELSYLLWATQGVDMDATRAFQEWLKSKGNATAAKTVAPLRTVPSGGSRHPFETYLLLNRVVGLESGLYRYLHLNHKLLKLSNSSDLREKIHSALSQWMQKSAVIFIWTAIPYRTEWRYTVVAHKMIAQESGHVCQNLYLACESIGVGTCAIGGYDQAKVDDLLSVDGESEFTVYLAPVGKVTPATYHFEH